jgi:hypothetical protein
MLPAADGWRVGVLDADLHGPRLARMLGTRGAALRLSPEGLHPAEGPLGIKVLSEHADTAAGRALRALAGRVRTLLSPAGASR